MTDQQKEKLMNRIKSGQSIEMLCWEFKMNKKDIKKFSKEHNLILRTTDSIRHANKFYLRMK